MKSKQVMFIVVLLLILLFFDIKLVFMFLASWAIVTIVITTIDILIDKI